MDAATDAAYHTVFQAVQKHVVVSGLSINEKFSDAFFLNIHMFINNAIAGNVS